MAVVVLIPATGLFFVHGVLDYKIAMDDYVLVATAKSLHETRQVDYTLSGKYVGHAFIPSQQSVDKRPWFYPFVVSLVHDLSGYRESNAFLVNAAVGVAFLAGAYTLGFWIGGFRGAVLSVLLWLTLPLLPQNATGAGMEMLNLLLIQCVMVLSILYLKAPDRAREGALCLTAVLLTYTRYESAIFLLPVAIVVIVGWARKREVLLSWGAVASAPLLLAVALHNRTYSATEASWELIDGATRPFSLAHLTENVPHALYFFFSPGDGLANSLLLSLLGFPAVLMFYLLYRTEWRGFWKERVEGLVVGLFGVFLILHLLVVLSFHASKLDSLYVSRYALPIHLLLVPAVVFVADKKLKWAATWRALFIAVGVFILTFTMPMKAKAIYTKSNFFVREMSWLQANREVWMPPKSLVIDTYTIPWSLWEQPARLPEWVGRKRETLREALEKGFYPAAFFVDRLEYREAEFRSKGGEFDRLSEVWDLDLVAERSFRPFELTRLYRLEWRGESVSAGE